MVLVMVVAAMLLVRSASCSAFITIEPTLEGVIVAASVFPEAVAAPLSSTFTLVLGVMVILIGWLLFLEPAWNKRTSACPLYSVLKSANARVLASR